MARIDYGQVPHINPDLKTAWRVSRKSGVRKYIHKKYIPNECINSPNKGYHGFSLVGKSRKTERWSLLEVWRYV